MTDIPKGSTPEIDDSSNPTAVAPGEPLTLEGETGSTAGYAAESSYASDSTYGSATDTISDTDAVSASAAGTTGAAGGFGATEPSSGGSATSSSYTSWSPRNGDAGSQGNQMVGQLQGMIDNVAHQAAPVLRDVAAKAAELAALAAERAGPLAHKAAEVTEDVGQRVAQRSREVATDLRRQGSDGGSDIGTTATEQQHGGTERPPTTPGI